MEFFLFILAVFSSKYGIFVFELKEYINYYTSTLFDIFKKQGTIIAIQGLKHIGKNVCIFSYYQPKGLKKTTIEYLKHLSEECDYSIMLVSTSQISEKDVLILQKYCTEIIIKSNVGYDFGSYKYGILKLYDKRQELDNILIANDSVIGPLFSLKEVFHKMNQSSCDFWGISDNIDKNRTHHITSWFVNFKSTVVQSESFWAFWQQYTPKSQRKYTINKGEVKLSTILYAAGFKSDALITINNVHQMLLDNPSFIANNAHFLTTNYILYQLVFKKYFQYCNSTTEIGEKNYNIANILCGQHFAISAFYAFHLILIAHLRQPFIKRDIYARRKKPKLINYTEAQVGQLLNQIQIETSITKEDVIYELRV